MIKRLLSIFFKLGLLSIAIFGLVLTYQNYHSVAEISSYFTTIVNWVSVIVIIYAMIFEILNLPIKGILYFWYQCVIVMFMVTMFVYAILLVPYLIQQNIGYEVFSFRDTIIHFIVPILLVTDYFFFTRKGYARSWMISINVLIPFFYLGYLQVYDAMGGRFTMGETTNRFPYYFLNVEAIGWGVFLVYLVGMLGFVILVSWIFYTIDRIVSTPLKPLYKISKSK